MVDKYPWNSIIAKQMICRSYFVFEMQIASWENLLGLYKICTFVEIYDLSVIQMNYQTFQVCLHRRLTEESVLTKTAN